MEKKVTITREEFIEKSAEAAANVMDRLSQKDGGGGKVFAIFLIGGIISSELADVIFGKEEKYS